MESLQNLYTLGLHHARTNLPNLGYTFMSRNNTVTKYERPIKFEYFRDCLLRDMKLYPTFGPKWAGKC